MNSRDSEQHEADTNLVSCKLQIYPLLLLNGFVSMFTPFIAGDGT